MGKKRKLESCSHQPRLESSSSLSSLNSSSDCRICGKEPVGPAKKPLSTRKKSKQDDFVVNFRIPNPVTLFSNRVVKKNAFFTNLKVKCHPIGNSPLVPKRTKRSSSQPKKTESSSKNVGEQEKKPLWSNEDENLYSVPHEIVLHEGGKTNNNSAEIDQHQPQLQLRPLFFEVPLEESPVFVPRNWIFSTIHQIFVENSLARGITIHGTPGTGKTAIALELVEYSCFGRKRDQNLDLESGRISAMSIRTDDSEEESFKDESDGLVALKALVQNVVAYHFCQLDNRSTCLVPEFIHSLAAQLCQAPTLVAYRKYLLANPILLDGLSLENCTVNPGKAFLTGIIEPLNLLKRAQTLQGYFIIIIDSIGEAECHKTSTRDTIASFLSKQIFRIPHWLKFIVTIRTSQLETLSLIPFKKISLDTMSDEIEEDLHAYINFRISANASIKSNVAASMVSANRSEVSVLKGLRNHLTHLSGGCFLYLKLTLDLIQHGHLVIKSSGFKVLPISLSEVFSLHCNLRFPTPRAFSLVHPILSTCLAALNPLTLLEIYHSINSLRATENLEWTQFLRIFKNLKGLLIKRLDGTYMFFHSSFRDWLVRKDENDAKFLCDIRVGNSAIAFRLSSIEAPLSPNKTIELAHHILKAGIFKNSSLLSPMKTSNIANKDLQALWLLTATKDIDNAICSFSNVYTPNPKVTKLLLQAGASPNQKSPYFKHAPLLGAFSAAGFFSIVSLLIEFGADVNCQNDDGDSPLHLSCEKGHIDIVTLLVENDASLFQVNNANETPLLKAAKHNQIEVLVYLTSLEEDCFAPSNKITLIKEALVAACFHNHIDVVDVCSDYVEDFNFVDSTTCETPMSSASKSGHPHIISGLILEGANPDMPNGKGVPPLIVAAKEQRHRVIEALVEGGCNLNVTDIQGKTALMYAAKQNDLISLEYLIKKGANVKIRDKDGICALGWACLRSNTDAVELILESENAEVNGVDNLGRTPLDLAAFTGAEEVATMLLEKGGMIEHIDLQGIRPLDRAVGCGHTSLVQLFLRRGAKLGSNTWAMASSKPEIIKCLLNKLLEDGVFLFHQGQYREAAHRFQYSLRKVPSHEYGNNERTQSEFEEILKSLKLYLIRCKIKMNEHDEAMNMVLEIIEKFPQSPEAFYEKAQIQKCMGMNDAARKDALFALALNEKDPVNSIDFRHQLDDLLDEISK